LAILLLDRKQTGFMKLWGEIMSEQVYPEPTVGALIFNKKGELLLVKSHKWFDKFTIPGGHVELGEKMKDALKREVKEEVGLDVEDLELINTGEAIFTPDFAKKKHFIFLDFACKCKNDKITLDNNEIQSYVWVDPKEALKLNLNSFLRNTLEKYLKRI
jgi:nucleoside triphosphatase